MCGLCRRPHFQVPTFTGFTLNSCYHSCSPKVVLKHSSLQRNLELWAPLVAGCLDVHATQVHKIVQPIMLCKPLFYSSCQS